MWQAAALRAYALLGVCGASLALCAQQIRGDWVTEFVRANALSLHNRQRLIATMMAVAGLAILGGVAVAWRRGLPTLRRVTHIAAPLALTGVLPALLRPAAWDALNAALAIGAVVLVLERVTHMALGAAPATTIAIGPLLARVPAWLRARAPLLIVIAASLGYAIYFSVFTLRMHGRFQTFGYDLGQYDNIFWSTLHGKPLHCEPLGLTANWSELRNHAELAVFFLLPFYALHPHASTLLVMQSALLGLGAIPLYRFAARRLPHAWAAVIAIAYLLYPPLHGLQFYDFHFQPIAVTFVLFVIDFVDEQRWMPAAIAFVIALTCREDISVGLAVLGAFLALSGHRLRAGLIMAAAAGAYFVLIRFVIMPRFGAWYFEDIYKDLLPEGARNFSGVIGTLVTNPTYVLRSILTTEKLRYALQILVPVAFLPLRRAYLATALVPGTLFTLLTSRYAPTIDIGFQYSAHFVPYLFAASAVALAAYEAQARRAAAMVALVGGTVLCGVFWGAVPPRATVHGGFYDLPMTAPTEAERQKHRDLQEMHALVPADATLAVSEAEMAHVSRLHTYSLRDTIDAEYLLYDVNSGFYGSNNGNNALASGDFVKMAERPPLVLLRRVRGQATPPTRAPAGSAAGNR